MGNEKRKRSNREISLLAFAVTAVSAVLAPILFAIAMAEAMPMGSRSPLPGILVPLSILLAVTAIVANLVAFVTGRRAWRSDGRPCPWIIINGILIAVTVWYIGMLLSL
jgi:uncharacterized membrane protein